MVFVHIHVFKRFYDRVNIGTEPAEEKKEDHGAAAMDVEDDDAVIAKLMKVCYWWVLRPYLFIHPKNFWFLQELAEVDTATVQPLKVNEFEKDDDTKYAKPRGLFYYCLLLNISNFVNLFFSFHIDFITVAANLRACNFHIKLTTRFHAKITAGSMQSHWLFYISVFNF